MFGWLQRLFASGVRENPAVSYSRFTDRARKVMQLANRESQRFNHEYVGTEHILLGLVKEGSGVAANVLKNLCIHLPKIRLEVEKIVQHGPGGEQVVMGRLPHTPRARKVLDYSVEEARNLNHNYVGTEHLLLGLLREQEGVAAQVLINLGLRLEDVREEVLNLLGQLAPGATVGHDGASIVKSLLPTAARTQGVPDRSPDEPLPRPETLADEQLSAAHHLFRYLAEQKESLIAAQDFERAAQCREGIVALERLLAWYDWARERT